MLSDINGIEIEHRTCRILAGRDKYGVPFYKNEVTGEITNGPSPAGLDELKATAARMNQDHRNWCNYIRVGGDSRCGATMETESGEIVTPCHKVRGHEGKHEGHCLGSKAVWSDL